MREIKFRFWNGDQMLNDFDGWSDHVGINEMFVSLSDNERVVMQFTGLKDKNGVDTYEGDIVVEVFTKSIPKDFGHNKEVKWDKMKTGFNLSVPNTEYEIIGNIFEHSNLLQP